MNERAAARGPQAMVFRDAVVTFNGVPMPGASIRYDLVDHVRQQMQPLRPIHVTGEVTLKEEDAKKLMSLFDELTRRDEELLELARAAVIIPSLDAEPALNVLADLLVLRQIIKVYERPEEIEGPPREEDSKPRPTPLEEAFRWAVEKTYNRFPKLNGRALDAWAHLLGIERRSAAGGANGAGSELAGMIGGANGAGSELAGMIGAATLESDDELRERLRIILASRGGF